MTLNVNFLRRMPLGRLLLLCGATVAIGISATAIALALGTGAKPAPKPLAQAVHDALAAPPIDGLSANVTLTDHLLEGANLASDAGGGTGGGLASNPLLTGASGRLWISKDGRARLELQSEKGDTELVYDGHTLTVYDGESNTVYRYTPKAEPGSAAPETSSGREAPSIGKIEEAIERIRKHAQLSEATPDDVAGRPAYTVRVAPKEGGSLIGGAELSFDASNGVPLRTAVYSSTSSAPVIELAASEVSYGPVPASVFDISPPPGAKIEEIAPATGQHAKRSSNAKDGAKLTSHGNGITSIAVLEAKAGSNKGGETLEGLPKVRIGGVSAEELKTALGTVLTFERAGTRYVVAGALPASSIEALARSL